MTQQQRTDLRTRYRALTQRVDARGSDQQYGQPGYQTGGRWQSLSTMNTDFERRLAMGLQNRTLTRAEATRLRTDWQSLGRTELSYRTGGIDAREEADLWARYNAIDSRLGGIGGGNMGGGFGDDRNTARWSQMETRLAEAERNGRISRVEAVQVRAQLGDLARLDTAYSAGGYNSTDRAYLTRRYGEIEQLLAARR